MLGNGEVLGSCDALGLGLAKFDHRHFVLLVTHSAATYRKTSRCHSGFSGAGTAFRPKTQKSIALASKPCSRISARRTRRWTMGPPQGTYSSRTLSMMLRLSVFFMTVVSTLA